MFTKYDRQRSFLVTGASLTSISPFMPSSSVDDIPVAPVGLFLGGD